MLDSSPIAAQSPAVSAPLAGRLDGVPAPKRDRRLTLTKVDRRSRLGKRITELQAMFLGEVGGDVTPMRRLRVEKAARLTALAELAQGDYARDGKGALKDVLLAERRAAAAVKALGLDEAPPPKPPEPAAWEVLQAAVAARHAAEDSGEEA